MGHSTAGSHRHQLGESGGLELKERGVGVSRHNKRFYTRKVFKKQKPDLQTYLTATNTLQQEERKRKKSLQKQKDQQRIEQKWNLLQDKQQELANITEKIDSFNKKKGHLTSQINIFNEKSPKYREQNYQLSAIAQKIKGFYKQKSSIEKKIAELDDCLSQFEEEEKGKSFCEQGGIFVRELFESDQNKGYFLTTILCTTCAFFTFAAVHYIASIPD